jgi:hypothetical protein
MTMRRRSTPPAVIDDLVARFQARPALADADVGYGTPPEIQPKLTRVYVLDAEDNVRTPLTQQGARNESYVVPVFVQSHSPGQDARGGPRRLVRPARGA